MRYGKSVRFVHSQQSQSVAEDFRHGLGWILLRWISLESSDLNIQGFAYNYSSSTNHILSQQGGIKFIKIDSKKKVLW